VLDKADPSKRYEKSPKIRSTCSGDIGAQSSCTSTDEVEYSLLESSTTGNTLVQCSIGDNSLKCWITRELMEQIFSRVLKKLVITSRCFNTFTNGFHHWKAEIPYYHAG
jgi:hypothetical protein